MKDDKQPADDADTWFTLRPSARVFIVELGCVVSGPRRSLDPKFETLYEPHLLLLRSQRPRQSPRIVLRPQSSLAV
ncbi:hypothetical protein CVT26_002445 [Gymnopilus dilepis]|uniref:Uncharacterized protein n=1 Tax=Gymnopilus dilepis TaxID=231916 RepID=A0A409Y3R1_9AGAR|nr:hypothetical protein CVT26_002445 [Gymnopilus dilepis]